MHETLQQFAELVGRCLACRWLREREEAEGRARKHAADAPGNERPPSDLEIPGSPDDGKPAAATTMNHVADRTSDVS